MRKLIIILFSLIACLFMISQVLAQTSYQFPDTGQTTCYDADHNEVSCDTIQPGDPYYGQDAHYQPRITRSYTKLGYGGMVLPDNSQHVDNGGPWIMTRDNVTGLIWEIKTEANRNDKYTWHDAEGAFIAALNISKFGGFDDWRLPTINELASLRNFGQQNPAINLEWFPMTLPAFYWSHTLDVDFNIFAEAAGLFSEGIALGIGFSEATAQVFLRTNGK